MGNKSCKLTVRISPWQEQVLSELSNTLNVSYSMLVRTIIGNWLTMNEEHLYRIIDKKKFEDADNKKVGEEKDIFSEERD